VTKKVFNHNWKTEDRCAISGERILLGKWMMGGGRGDSGNGSEQQGISSLRLIYFSFNVIEKVNEKKEMFFM